MYRHFSIANVPDPLDVFGFEDREMCKSSMTSGEYDPSSSSVGKTTIQVHTTYKSNEKPLKLVSLLREQTWT